jgi:hypothetical protein
MSTLIRYKATGHTRLVADFAARRLIASGIATAAQAASVETAAPTNPDPQPESVVEKASEQAYETRELQAEPVATPPAPRKKADKLAKADKPKREYKTRALKSQD